MLTVVLALPAALHVQLVPAGAHSLGWDSARSFKDLRTGPASLHGTAPWGGWQSHVAVQGIALKPCTLQPWLCSTHTITSMRCFKLLQTQCNLL